MKCPTKNCEEVISDRSKMLYCVNCRAGMGRAERLGPDYIERRQMALLKFTYRLQNIKRRSNKRGK